MEKIEYIEHNGEKYTFAGPVEYAYERIASRPDSDFKDAIHWRVTINGQSWEYSCGIGHYFNGGYRYQKCEYAYRKACEDIKAGLIAGDKSIGLDYYTGAALEEQKKAIKNLTKKVKYKKSWHSIRIVSIEGPELIDVLHSLAMDSSALDECFSDWCANFGYDSDSIRARAIYDACIESGHKLRKAGIDWRELSEFLQDY